MKIIITCGPSYEPIDEVRRITNFSTGRLGTRLANAFAARGWEVTCFRGEHATCCEPFVDVQVRTFSTNADLARQLETFALDHRADAVFHAAALCDFTVGRVLDESGNTVQSAKLSTRQGQLRLELKPAPKILPLLRTWFPAARIVGWKYELAGRRDDALGKAQAQIAECRSDACVVNGRAYGSGYGLCYPAGEPVHCADDTKLAETLIRCAARDAAFTQ